MLGGERRLLLATAASALSTRGLAMDYAKPTSETFWWITLALGAVDVGLLLLVSRSVGREVFLRLKWQVSATASALYAALWGVFASLLYWDLVYQYVFPAWSRWFLPVWYGVLFGLVARGFWTLSLRLPGSPAVTFCLLGGLVSLAGHSWGIRRGLLRVPFLDQVSPASALAVGFVEFIVYWCAIVGLGLGLWRLAGNDIRPAPRP